MNIKNKYIILRIGKNINIILVVFMFKNQIYSLKFNKIFYDCLHLFLKIKVLDRTKNGRKNTKERSLPFPLFSTRVGITGEPYLRAYFSSLFSRTRGMPKKNALLPNQTPKTNVRIPKHFWTF